MARRANAYAIWGESPRGEGGDGAGGEAASEVVTNLEVPQGRVACRRGMGRAP
jgi:hypothetical protein